MDILQVIIDSQPLTVAVLAALLFGESIGVVGAAGLVLGADPQGNPPFSPFSEPHECYCLALFMCPPLSSLDLFFMIA